MGDMRLSGPAAAVLMAAALVAVLVPPFRSTHDGHELYEAVATAGALIALFAGGLLVARFLQSGRTSEFALICSLLALALSQLAFAAVPVGSARVAQDLMAWASEAGRAVGAALFALAAFVPPRRLDRPGRALASGAAAVTATLVLIAFLAVSFAPGVPATPGAATAARIQVRTVDHTNVALLALGTTVATCYVLASAGFLRRTGRAGRLRDDLPGWLAVAAILAAAGEVDLTLHRALSGRVLTLGQILQLASFAVIFTGSAFHVRSHWQAPTGAAVQEERRRIARDLHDGLVQDLAYLGRHLDAIAGTADAETKEHLQRAVERAQSEARLAVASLARADREPFDVMIANAVGEIAARDHIELTLDIPPRIRVPAARAEALIHIASEAVGNAARHSGAGHVTLSVRRLGPRIRLLVSDSGSGFDPATRCGGFGFASMHERARLVGGDVRIHSVPGGGTEVEATV